MTPLNLDGRLIAFERIMHEPIPPVDWLVKPLIAHGDRGVFYGEYASMKSWALLHMGLHIAAGRDWLGEFHISKSRSVLFLDEEMSAQLLRRRLKQLATGAGLHDEPLPFRAITHLGKRFTASNVQALLEGLKAQGFDPEVIMIETLRRVLDGNENEARDIAAFWESLEPFVKAGKTIIVSHHMKKPGPLGRGEARHQASGSTDIIAAVDCSYAVTRQKETITLNCVKLRAAEEAAPFVVQLVDLEGEDDPVQLVYVGNKEVEKDGEDRTLFAAKRLKEFLDDHPGREVETKILVSQLQVTAGVGARTVERALSHCVTQGWITKVRHGVYRSLATAQVT